MTLTFQPPPDVAPSEDEVLAAHDAEQDLVLGRPPMTLEGVLALMEEHDCNVSAVARALFRRRAQVKGYIDSHPILAKMLQDDREELVDLAESVVRKALHRGSEGMAKHVVSTLGKDRGWTPRAEHTGKDGKDLIPGLPTFTIVEQAADEPNRAD